MLFNQDGKNCNIHKQDKNFPCHGGFVISRSLGNIGTEDSFKLSSILNFVFVIVALVVAFIYRNVQTVTANNIDQQTITAADYTVMVYGIPKGEKEEDIKAEFEEKLKRGGESKSARVKRVHMAYKIGRIVSLQRKKKRLENKKFLSVQKQLRLDAIETELEFYHKQYEDSILNVEKQDQVKDSQKKKEMIKKYNCKRKNMSSYIIWFGSLMRRNKRLEEEIEPIKQQEKSEESNKRLTNLEEKLNENNEAIKFCESYIYNPLTKFTGIAFVTFESEQGKICLNSSLKCIRCQAYY